MDHLLEGYPCEVIVYDILVWGSTEAEHDENLLKVLDRIQEINLKLKWDKCKFKVKEVGYVRHLLTADGLKPDPEKVRAIIEMQTPENVKELQRFRGMVRYLSKFIPRLSELALPLQPISCMQMYLGLGIASTKELLIALRLRLVQRLLCSFTL